MDVPVGTFPFTFNGKLPGLYAIGVKTMKGGEIVIRRPAAASVIKDDSTYRRPT